MPAGNPLLICLKQRIFRYPKHWVAHTTSGFTLKNFNMLHCRMVRNEGCGRSLKENNMLTEHHVKNKEMMIRFSELWQDWESDSWLRGSLRPAITRSTLQLVVVKRKALSGTTQEQKQTASIQKSYKTSFKLGYSRVQGGVSTHVGHSWPFCSLNLRVA